MFIFIIIIVCAVVIFLLIRTALRDTPAETQIASETQDATETKSAWLDIDFLLATVPEDDYSFVAIDFETATANRMVCEMGICIVENGEITQTKDYLIKPPHNRYNSNNVKVHGITPIKTEDCLTFDKLWPEIRQLLIGRQIIAHNASFDLDCLNKNLLYYNLPQLSVKAICTSKMLDRIDLVSACTYYNIELGNHHNALDDAIACAKLRLAYLKQPVEASIIPRIRKEKYAKQLTGRSYTCSDYESYFFGKTIVLTGVFSYWIDRNALAQELIEKGARITASVSSRTNILVTGYEPGTAKVEKAQALEEEGYDIEIIDEHELYELMYSNDKKSCH